MNRLQIPKLEGHHCFACGTENSRGLNLYFYRDDDWVCSDVVLEKWHEGWENMAHGGILSTLLDEIMSWTIIYFKRIFFVTRKMEVRYLKPVVIGEPLSVRGRISEERPPRITARAEILNDSGSVLVKGMGEFVEIPEDRLQAVPEALKKDMKALFDRMPPL
ncbi:MAG: PaaI family thioesterase [Deltaproteobacteria bacterium]|nr:PaaI family thioesterase [Deltaproteobacteria bacterium]